ncbi:MAG: hypothetical protein O3B41_05205 [Bacteroidetes bacterium]|nr:hypothetical protein [Bacteroidota bacterium]
MRVIKYFFEEPTLLDFQESASESFLGVVSFNVTLAGAARHYRGYLAASDLESRTIGGSSLEDQAAAKILAQVIEGPGWYFSRGSGANESIKTQLLSSSDTILQALVTMPAESLLVTNFNPMGQELTALVNRSNEKNTFGAIVRLLDLGATIILPEPAHVGHDWSVFSSKPLSESFRMAAQEMAPEDCRCFVVPYGRAKGEHKFYFEQYDIELFKEFEI